MGMYLDLEDVTSGHPKAREKLQALYAEIDSLKKDADRYRRLAILVEAGDWSVGQHIVIDKYGMTHDIYMDDKSDMDKTLDMPHIIADAEAWSKAMST